MTSTARKQLGRPRHWTVEEEQRRILDAGHSIFAERGFDGATIDAIAKLAEVQRPVVYAHFGPKDDLFEACVNDAGELILHALAEGFGTVSDLSWQDRVRQCYTVFFSISATRGDAMRMLFQADKDIPKKPMPDSPSKRMRKRVLNKLTEYVQERLRPGGIVGPAASEILSLMIYSTGWMVAEQQIAQGWNKDALIDILTDFTCGGISRLWKHELEPLKALDGPARH